MGSLQLNGTQGGAHTRTQTTTESLRSSQTALLAHIPSGRAKEPSATSESSTPTAHEAPELAAPATPAGEE